MDFKLTNYIHKTSTISFILKGEKLPWLFNIVLEVLAGVLRQEKDMAAGKEEIQLSLFRVDIMA